MGKKYFQALGKISGEILIKDAKQIYIEIEGKQFQIVPHSKGYKTMYSLTCDLKEGKQPKELLVYPQFIHTPSSKTEAADKSASPRNLGDSSTWAKPKTASPRKPVPKSKISSKVKFALVAFGDEICHELNSGEFNLHGVWQFIPTSRLPVVSVYRNNTPELESLLNSEKNSVHLKAQHIPALMRDNVPPYRYTKEGDRDKYFVSIRTKFNPRGEVMEFIENIAEPTTKIPSFKKNDSGGKKPKSKAPKMGKRKHNPKKVVTATVA